ncbi:MAG: VOC family protein [Acidimicrobiia bacterium]|nr:VOC family protein [Acidimicrobiia bacterium]
MTRRKRSRGWSSSAPATSTSVRAQARVDQQAEVDRLVTLGATRIDIGQGDVGWVVMADPDDNEFCALSPR